VNFPIGTRIDRYVVDGVLGKGGMAVVYLVRHEQLGSHHALKVLSFIDPEVRDRLMKEGRAQSTLAHPNIVRVTDVVNVFQTEPALVLEYVNGPSLDVLLDGGRLSLPAADRLARGILTGVAAAHRQDLIHRDLKPANVMVAIEDDRLVPKVTDFGLAKIVGLVDPQGIQTRAGVALGTPAYMAPEQIRDASGVDARADVWALGVMLYELVTGERAFRRNDVLAVYQAVTDADYPPLSEVAPDLPERMRVAIEGALQPDPQARFADADAMLAAWAADSAALEDPHPTPLIGRARSLRRAPEVTPSSDGPSWPQRPNVANTVMFSEFDAPDDSGGEPDQPTPVASRPSAGLSMGLGLAAGGATLAAGLAVMSLIIAVAVMSFREQDRVAWYRDIAVRDGAWAGVQELTEDQAAGNAWAYRIEESGGRAVRISWRAWHADRAEPWTEWRYEVPPSTIVQSFDAADQPLRIEWRDPYERLRHIVNVEWSDEATVRWRHANRFGVPAPRVDGNPIVEEISLDESGRADQVRYYNRTGLNPVPDRSGAYGLRHERGAAGEVIRSVALNGRGVEAADTSGAMTAEYAYADARFPYLPTEIRYLGSGGELVPGPHTNPAGVGISGAGIEHRTYDDDGNTVREDHRVADDGPGINLIGCASVTHVFDDAGQLVRHTCLGAGGEPVFSTQGWSAIAFEWLDGCPVATRPLDRKGNPTATRRNAWGSHSECGEGAQPFRVTTVDANGEPTMGRLGYATEEVTFDETGQAVQWRFLDPAGEPVINARGFATNEQDWDAAGNMVGRRQFGVDGEPVDGLGGYHRLSQRFDDRGQRIEVAIYDREDRITATPKTAARTEREYDQRGYETAVRCFDVLGEPTWCPEGWGGATVRRDDYGRTVEHAFFAPDGTPTNSSGGFARATRAYNERGQLETLEYFGIDGRPTTSRNGVFREVATHDARGNVAGFAVFDVHGDPTHNVQGFHRVVEAYDDRNRKIETAWFGARGEPVSPRGYHRLRRVYDDRGLVVELGYLDASGHATQRTMHEYDARGNLVAERTYDTKGRPRAGFGPGLVGRLYAWDAGSREIGVRFEGDFEQGDVAEIRLMRDARGQVIDEILIDREGGPTMGSPPELGIDDLPKRAFEAPFARRHLEWSPTGELVGWTLFDASDNPIGDERSVHRVQLTLDPQGNEIRRVHFGVEGELAAGPGGAHKVLTARTPQGRPIEQRFFGPDGEEIHQPDP